MIESNDIGTKLGRLALLPVLATLALGLAACDDADDDDDKGSNLGEGPGGCIDTETVVAIDDMTPLGFTAADVLSLVGGDQSHELTWYGDEFAGPGMGSSTANYSLDVANVGAIKFIESEPDPDNMWKIDSGCEDHVTIETTLDFATEDGVLDETVSVTIYSSDGTSASWRGDMKPADLKGSFPKQPTDPDFDLTMVDFNGDHGPTGVGGSINVEVQSKGDGPDGVAGYGIVGGWGTNDGGI